MSEAYVCGECGNRQPLRELLTRRVAALQRRIAALEAALTDIAEDGCETYREGDCYTNGRSERAQYLADRVCDPCRAQYALTVRSALTPPGEGA